MIELICLCLVTVLSQFRFRMFKHLLSTLRTVLNIFIGAIRKWSGIFNLCTNLPCVIIFTVVTTLSVFLFVRHVGRQAYEYNSKYKFLAALIKFTPLSVSQVYTNISLNQELSSYKFNCSNCAVKHGFQSSNAGLNRQRDIF